MEQNESLGFAGGGTLGYSVGMILQSSLPYDVSVPRALPGIQPLAMADWLMVDDAFAGQMARREALLAERPGAVLAEAPGSVAAAELLDVVLTHLGSGYVRDGDRVTRPDGGLVELDRARPLWTLGHLVQEDLCLMERPEGAAEHVMTAAVLCFPASWMLAEKIGRPLTGIHVPVPRYDAGIAARVQRLFDGVQPGRPLWRWNALYYADPELHQPRSEGARRARPVDPGFLRSERQCLVRLPESRAVVFSIHTFVVARGSLPDAEWLFHGA